MQFQEIPPEIQAKIDEQHALVKLVSQDNWHKEQDLLEALDDEQLDEFDTMLYHAGNNPQYVPFLRGQISAMRKAKFKTCPCGTSHDVSELVDAIKDPEPEVPGEVVPDAGPDEDVPPGEIEAVGLPVPIEDVDEGLRAASEEFERASNMREYGLIIHTDGTLRCKDCGLTYVSVEDRMLKPVGITGCHGCQQKSGDGTTFWR